MKSKVFVSMLIATLMLTIGVTILLTCHTKWLVLTAALLAITGLFYTLGILGWLLLKVDKEVFKFIHMYWRNDCKNSSTYLIGICDQEAIEVLKEESGHKNLDKLFEVNSIIIEGKHTLNFDGRAREKITGMVYANNKDEALKLIAEERFGEYDEDDYNLLLLSSAGSIR